MKLRCLILIVVAFSSPYLRAQGAKEVFDSREPITWLGIDFTGAIFLGDRERLGSETVMRDLIRAWNNLMITEREKYDINAMLGKTNVEYNVEVAIAHNEKLTLANYYSEDLKDNIHLNASVIREIVKYYDLSDLSGVGLMFNVESFNKLSTEALVWITFIDLNTKEVIFTERMKAPPGGFGLRNYWAGAIYAMIKQIERKNFDEWRKKYSHKVN